jgi:Holliday junction resolvasome RuvABC DNA-binding subunit
MKFQCRKSNTNRDEALSALEVLGFVRKTSEKIIEKVKEDPEASVESIIKKSKTYKIKFKKFGLYV